MKILLLVWGVPIRCPRDCTGDTSLRTESVTFLLCTRMEVRNPSLPQGSPSL